MEERHPRPSQLYQAALAAAAPSSGGGQEWPVRTTLPETEAPNQAPKLNFPSLRKPAFSHVESREAHRSLPPLPRLVQGAQEHRPLPWWSSGNSFCSPITNTLGQVAEGCVPIEGPSLNNAAGLPAATLCLLGPRRPPGLSGTQGGGSWEVRKDSRTLDGDRSGLLVSLATLKPI